MRFLKLFMEPFERNEQENEDDFSARWETTDPMLLSIVKSFLDSREIHYFVVGEECFFRRSRRSSGQSLCNSIFSKLRLSDFIGVFRKRKSLKIGIVKHLNARPLTWGFEKIRNTRLFRKIPPF